MSMKLRVLRAFGWGLTGLAALTMLYFGWKMLLGGVSTVSPALTCIGAVCTPLALGTAALVLAAREVATRRRIVRTVLEALFAFYIAALFAVLVFARIDFREYAAERAFYRANYALMTNFVPFRTIRLYIRCLIFHYIDPSTSMSNLFGNVLLFMPMAFFLPCLFRSMRTPWKFIVLMVLLLSATEALQLILCCGSCDVDDVILNLAGTMAVYGFLHIPFVRRALVRLYIYPQDQAGS